MQTYHLTLNNRLSLTHHSHRIASLILRDIRERYIHTRRHHFVFLLTLRCFIASRGKLKEILSDNGSDFIGRDRELSETLDKLGQRKICNDLSSQNIIWKFNTPLSPWVGGA